MSFKFVFLATANEQTRTYADAMAKVAPGLEVVYAAERSQQLAALAGARACFGTLDAELLAAAPQLEWLAAPAAGPPKGYYFAELIASRAQVTNFRGIFNDHISAHIMAFVLCFARGMHQYFHDQYEGEWRKGGEMRPSAHLPEATALIVGIGGIGSATAVHCKHFGMRVIGVDPRVQAAPDGVDELKLPADLDALLPQADFVILTAPQTPSTEGLFTAAKFERMKETAFFINIGRGSNVALTDLDRALRDGGIAGAALDVFETEPLPADHPLWTAPNFLMTPHTAAAGPYLGQRRLDLMVENCRRFAVGEELVNVVDKANWF
ncbi:MAG: phosphoglycerate dehydrogenase-like enzyme [Candidatus Latescibacterota bacterium]|jgi:phosphoglycerate dehydrogenase-like enzyme